jgi:hypothetical protein
VDGIGHGVAHARSLYIRAMRRSAIAIAAVVISGLLGAVPAGAAQSRTIGKAAPVGASPGSCGNCEAFAFATAPESPSYAVPKGRWKIVSWKAAGDETDPAQARLGIYRPSATAGQFKLVKETAFKNFQGGVKTSHKANIRVRRGDVIGIETNGSMPIVYDSTRDADQTASPTCQPQVGDQVGTGTLCPTNTSSSRRVNVAATLKRRG